MEQELAIEAKYQALCGRLHEATLRLWAATEARSLGRGGVTLVAKATGLSRTTIHAGLSELNAPVSAGEQGVQLRARAAGGGRNPFLLTGSDPGAAQGTGLSALPTMVHGVAEPGCPGLFGRCF